jgi:hypothetical protein
MWIRRLAVTLVASALGALGPSALIDAGTRSPCQTDPGLFDYGPHRDDQEAELLVMEATGELRAPDEEYERVRRDLALIREAIPYLESVVDQPDWTPDRMPVNMDPTLPWDDYEALNVYYQVIDVDHFINNWYYLTFCDNINIPQLYPIYKALPEVIQAHPDWLTDYTGNQIVVTGMGATYTYQVVDGFNDCPSGCLCERVWAIGVDQSGAVDVLSYYEAGWPGECVFQDTACCLPAGVCGVMSIGSCHGQGGAPLPFTSPCEGDLDGDGVDARCGDACPDDPDKTDPGICGCNVPDTDSNGDGVPDCADSCSLYVDPAGGPEADCTDLQTCIDDALAGCRIELAPGSYPGGVIVDKRLSIRGAPGATSTITGPSGGSAITVDDPLGAGPVRIQELRIVGGTQGIDAASDVEIIDVLILASSVGVRTSPPLEPVATLRRTVIEDSQNGISVKAGVVSLSNSRVWDANVHGSKVVDGHLEMAGSLVTDAIGSCVRIKAASTAKIVFSTIAGCDLGVENLNSGAGATTITSSIVYGNTTADLVGIGCDDVFYTNSQSSCCTAQGNACVDPLFVDPLNQDYRLDPTSPLMDAGGDPATFDGDPCCDYEGKPRLLDWDGDGLARPDMGAWEHENPDLIPGPVTDVMWLDRQTLIWNPQTVAFWYHVYRGATSQEVRRRCGWTTGFPLRARGGST